MHDQVEAEEPKLCTEPERESEQLDLVSCGSSQDQSSEGESTLEGQKYRYTDHAETSAVEDEPKQENEQANGKGETNLFPFKLHEMLSRPEFNEIVTWQAHGRSFKVLNRSRMEKEVLSRFFETANYNSFVRLLNAWQFRRKRCASTADRNQAEDDFGSYYHELFLRSKPNLLKKMQRLPRYNGKKLPMDSKDEPDFSKYPPLPQCKKVAVESDLGTLGKLIKSQVSKKRKAKESSVEDEPAVKSSKSEKEIHVPNLPLSGSRIPLEIRMAAAATLFGIVDEETDPVAKSESSEDADEACDADAKSETKKQIKEDENGEEPMKDDQHEDDNLETKKEVECVPKKASSSSSVKKPLSGSSLLRNKSFNMEQRAMQRYHHMMRTRAARMNAAYPHLPRRGLPHPCMMPYGAPFMPQPQQPIFVVVPVAHPADARSAVAAAAADYSINPMAYMPSQTGKHLHTIPRW